MIPMRRIPIQLDDKTYRALKSRAFAEGRSIASIVREGVAKLIGTSRRTIDDFAFVGFGEAAGDRARRVSENHDAALADAIAPRPRRRR